MKITPRDVAVFLLGGLFLMFAWDYYLTRGRARNGQAAYDFLVQKYGQQQQTAMPTPATTPAPATTPTPTATAK